MSGEQTIDYVPARSQAPRWYRPLLMTLLWTVLSPLVPIGLVALTAADLLPQHSFCCDYPRLATVLFPIASVVGIAGVLWFWFRAPSGVLRTRDHVVAVIAALFGAAGTLFAWGMSQAIRM